MDGIKSQFASAGLAAGATEIELPSSPANITAASSIPATATETGTDFVLPSSPAATAATNTQASSDFATIFMSTGNAGTAASNAVTTAIASGGDATTAVGSTITAAANTGSTSNVTTALSASVATAINNGADVTGTIDTAVNTAATGGVNVNVAAATAANAAANAGVDTTTASSVASNAAAAATTATNVVADTSTAANTGTTTNAVADTATDTAANTNVVSDTQVDTNTNTTTTTTVNANTNTNTTVTTDNNTDTTTTTNINNNSNVTTNVVTDLNTGIATNTVTDANSGISVNIVVDSETGEIVSIDGPGQVIDKDTVVVDGTPIDINTGEILTPEEVEERKKAVVNKTPVTRPKSAASPTGGGVNFTEPTYTAKKSDIAETWLGGRFRNIAPLAGLSALLPETTPMFQEAQALSALRRASGVEDDSENNEADYYAYGSEPSYSKVLQPYMNGGTVQKYADGGKIMASPLMAASGGDVPHKGSHYVQGAGGGQDDLISAKLADGEYVFDADIVAALGDGSNKEGAKKLDAMREAIRKHKRGGSIKSIPPAAKSPLAYLKGVL